MIELVGWSTHQHYKHRDAPWVKTYAKLVDDPLYRCLSYGARAFLLDLWLLGASTKDGRLHLASGALAWRLREAEASVSAWLTELAAIQDEDGPRWLTLHDLPEVLASCPQDASKTVLQSRGETEQRRVETEKSISRQKKARPKTTWLTPYHELYAELVGTPAGGQMAKAIKPIEDEVGTEMALRIFGRWCRSDAKKFGVTYFGANWRTWSEGAVAMYDEHGEPSPALLAAVGGR
jgi:hypothetical protein